MQRVVNTRVLSDDKELYSYVETNSRLMVADIVETVLNGIQSGDGGLLFAYGPVYSGKTLSACSLIDELHKHDLRVTPIQPDIGRPDLPTDRYVSRNGVEKKVESVKEKRQIIRVFDKSDIVLIDEVQFFQPELHSYLIKIIQDYIDRGGWVVAMGMLYTSQLSEFLLSAVMKERCLKDYALTSTCLKCGKRGARYNQRTINGLPTTIDDPELLAPSEKVVYEPRCIDCHVIIG